MNCKGTVWTAAHEKWCKFAGFILGRVLRNSSRTDRRLLLFLLAANFKDKTTEVFYSIQVLE